MKKLKCTTRKDNKFFFNVYNEKGKKLIVEFTGLIIYWRKYITGKYLLELAYEGAVKELKKKGYKVVEKREGVFYYGKG